LHAVVVSWTSSLLSGGKAQERERERKAHTYREKQEAFFFFASVFFFPFLVTQHLISIPFFDKATAVLFPSPSLSVPGIGKRKPTTKKPW